MFQFDSLSAFLIMDGHGPYVWASYIVTGLALKVLIWLPFAKKRELRIQLTRQQRIEQQAK